ncbi:hypothetical protein HYX18_00300 [Candidatus Woesearchaeota archaeon]|nr:hypothetical protein [Candidatus Woesearchaeota archaeon]
MNFKRGQISLFIILGIIIVFVIGLIFLVRSEILKTTLLSQVQKTEVVPVQLRPVKDAIDNCVAEVSTEALNLIGLQGGYINLPKDILSRGQFNKFSNSLEVIPGINTAYWFYETSNGIQKLNIPQKDQIKKDIDDYVKENLDSCLISLDEFRANEYVIDFKGTIEVNSKIQDQFVEVFVEYPVDIQFKDVGKSVKKHYAKIDYPLGEFYNLGIDILNNENDRFYFENITLDILTVYEDIPYAGQSFNCIPRVWQKNDIEKNLKNYIQVNVNAIKVKNTLTSSPNTYYLLDVGKSHSNVDTIFLFNQQWPFELSINGGEEILKEDSIVGVKNPATKLLVGLFCLNSYQFIYDIKYPILVQIAKNGYTFQYATQVIIDNNQPRYNRRSFSNIEEQDRLFCKSTPTENTIYALNADTGQSLENVEINAKCITTVCEIGRTSLNGNEAYLNAKVPSCINTEIIASKQGFNDGITVTDTNEQGTINLELKPKYDLELEIKILEDSTIRNLDSDENVLIEFSNEQDNYYAVANKEVKNVELISGTYSLNTYLLITSRNITLPGSDYEKCTDVPRAGILGFIGLKDKKCFTTKIDPINLDQILTGGDVFDVEFDKEQLSKANKIIVYITKNKTPASVEDLKSIIDFINSNSNNPQFRRPELI